MKNVLVPIVLSAAVFAAPLSAEEQSKTDQGLSLLDQGAKLLFEGLLQEMEPALNDLKGLATELEPRFQALMSEMGPAFVELLDKVDDFRNYEAPVILENGDILIRRHPDAPDYIAPEPIDL